MKTLLLSISLFLACSCAAEDLMADSLESGTGDIKATRVEVGAMAAVYDAATTDPNLLRFGKTDLYFVDIGEHTYLEDWGEVDTFKQLGPGTQVDFSATGQLVRVGSTSMMRKNYRVVRIMPRQRTK